MLWQRSTASVSAQDVNGRMIVAVDHMIIIAVLLELEHVVLNSTSGAKRLIDAVLKSTGIIRVVSVLHGLLGIRPVRTGDAEETANLSVAGQRAVAVAHRLANTAQADVSDWSGISGLILSHGLGLQLLLLLRRQLELFRIEGECRLWLRRKRLLRLRWLLRQLLLSLVSSYGREIKCGI